ncbi:hypothetical protein CKM354_000677400 [Cercospora kikuchii]|uniref:Phosphoribulokinase/uridine kinase domain-containing protein n=1 Tax=Cercospora kikuchii TaxID=84275 RepID=A0A9P3CLG4_9PEZI|nr:uncharacterized protein CKM354_000677400 [Cercospora kikuchii]GIZ43552.1 hypothetical protein CKM354_000677400 [Cercospora kikuchii]
MHQEQLSNQLADRIVSHYHNIPYKEDAHPNNTKRKLCSRRCLVALAGGPGSGKSTIAASISAAVAERGVKCQAISIEGFMKPKKDLTDDMMKRRGAMETFDGEAAVDLLKKMRQLGPGHEIRAPTFDEEQGDPVPAVKQSKPAAKQSFSRGSTSWQIASHGNRWKAWSMRSGSFMIDKGMHQDKEEAYKVYDESDGLNNDFIAKHRYHTDVIIEANEEFVIKEPDGKEHK